MLIHRWYKKRLVQYQTWKSFSSNCWYADEHFMLSFHTKNICRNNFLGNFDCTSFRLGISFWNRKSDSCSDEKQSMKYVQWRKSWVVPVKRNKWLWHIIKPFTSCTRAESLFECVSKYAERPSPAPWSYICHDTSVARCAQQRQTKLHQPAARRIAPDRLLL